LTSSSSVVGTECCNAIDDPSFVANHDDGGCCDPCIDENDIPFLLFLLSLLLLLYRCDIIDANAVLPLHKRCRIRSSCINEFNVHTGALILTQNLVCIVLPFADVILVILLASSVSLLIVLTRLFKYTLIWLLIVFQY
jgi:hypothetical protein